MKNVKRILAMTLTAAMLLTGCSGGSKPKTIDVKEVAKEMVAATKFTDEMIEVSSDVLANYYATDNMESFSVYLCPTGGYAEEIAVIKAKPNKLEDVKTAAQQHIAARKTEFENYVPDEVTKLSAASVLTNGDYVAVIIAKDTQPAKDIFEKSFTSK